MESKHKNALIGALLAVVFVMAVGYAAFAQQLTINGSAEITSTWDVQIESIEVVDNKNGEARGTGTTGTATRESATSATFTANLVSPGDTVTYEVVVVNNGTIKAKLDSFTNPQNGADDMILYAVSGLTVGDTINPKASKDAAVTADNRKTFYVTAQYKDVAGGQGQPTAAQLTRSQQVVLSFSQATA